MRELIQTFIRFRHESKNHKTPFSFTWPFYFRWMKTLDRSKTALNYGLPWLTFPVISFLEKELKKGNKVFEFGGGGSSLFFLEKGCDVYTVEHDKIWFEQLSDHIEKKQLHEKWHGSFILPEKKTSSALLNPSKPEDYYSSNADYSEYTFKNYASKIDDLKDSELDLVLIDGRARPSCVYHSITKLKSNGFLIIDNTERDYYLEYFVKHFAKHFDLVMDEFGPVPYIKWFNKTSVWRKK
jgi:hypothetical protein